MVGIVVVSHSKALAEGVVALAREMGGGQLALEAAGGIGEPDVLGTNAELVREAIERAMSSDGVLVLMDLGSALMSAEFAVELLQDAPGPIRLSDAPLVEGAVAAAAAASGGAGLDEVAAEARGALGMKASQIGGAEQAPAEREEAPAETEGAVRSELAVRNEIGLHARPAARFVAVVRSFDADVRVAKPGNGPPVKATSLTGVVALGARQGDTLEVTATGPQAEDAVRALQELAEQGFGDGAATPAGETAAARAEPEQSEPPAPGSALHGVGVSAGVAIGSAHRLGGSMRAPPDRSPERSEKERVRLERALVDAREAVAHDRDLIAARAGIPEAEIFDAHLALLEDEALLEPAYAAISSGASAERAAYDAAQQVAARYRSLSEPLLQERAADVLDVGRRVVEAITGTAGGADAPTGIVVADELSPADAAALDPERALGIATARGSVTAHAAILARALGLPGVVGLGPQVLAVRDETMLLVDGETGTVVVDPPEEMLADARERQARDARRRAAARERAQEPAITRDGARIEVFANLGEAGEAADAVALGAEGVGLLRTEFLFLGREQLPDEEEQVATLSGIAAQLEGRPLVVRTLDAGADKPLPALPITPEANPFLGVRGIRLALARPDVLATQFRAILRVAAEHPVRAMLPMVATLEELSGASRLLEEARAQTGVTAPLELGIMVEVPAAALGADRFAPHVDFFSLGTNDLTQYTMAAERGNPELAPLLAGPQPAVLRLVRSTVAAAAAHGRWVGVCGELAGDPASAVLLAGLGVSELSMAPGVIPEVKAALREVEVRQAREAALEALETDDAHAARALARRLL